MPEPKPGEKRGPGPNVCLRGDVWGLSKSDTGIANERRFPGGGIYASDSGSKAKVKEQNGYGSWVRMWSVQKEARGQGLSAMILMLKVQVLPLQAGRPGP